MASAFFGLNRGQQDQGPDLVVSSATTTGSTDVELRVDLTKGCTKLDILLLTDALLRAIENPACPAGIIIPI